MKRPLLFRLLKTGAPLAVLLLFVCVGGLLAFLLAKGVPTLCKELLFGEAPALDAILGKQPVWDGLWPALAGSPIWWA